MLQANIVSYENFPYLSSPIKYKIQFIGYFGVGKTSLQNRICLNAFDQYWSTIGIDFVKFK